MCIYANEADLLCKLNLPSARWKHRRIVTANDKLLRKKDKECNKLREQIRNLEYIDLVTPIQRGYKRLFVLTEDTRHSKHAELYQNILNKINVVWYSPDKTFRKARKRRVAKWRYKNIGKEQKLQEYENYTFHNCLNLTEEEKALFYPIEYYHYPSKEWKKKYIFSESWRFNLRVRPNLITQIQRKDSLLEQKRDELYDFLDKEMNKRRLIKLSGGNTNGWKTFEKKNNPKEKYKNNPLHNKPLHQLEVEFDEEKKLLWKYEQKI